MVLQKFTVILLPQIEGGYQLFFPYYPECTTDGDTVEEALANAKEALEGILAVDAEHGGNPVPGYVHVQHVVVGALDIEAPNNLVESDVGTGESIIA